MQFQCDFTQHLLHVKCMQYMYVYLFLRIGSEYLGNALTSSDKNRDGNISISNRWTLEKQEMLSWRSLRRLAHKSKAD